MAGLPVYLVITSYFPTPESWRCAFVYDQVRAIQRTGRYRVVVLNTLYPSDYVYQGVEVLGCPSLWRTGTFLCPWLYERVNARIIEGVLARHAIDVGSIAVAHCHMVTVAAFGLALKRRNPRIKVLCQSHDLDPYKVLLTYARKNPFGIKTKLYFAYHRSLMEAVDAWVSISDACSEVLLNSPRQRHGADYRPMRSVMDILKRARKARVKTIIRLHNGVDRAMFSAVTKGRGESFTMGCIGNFFEGKGQADLLRALVLLDREKALGENWRLRCIGSGHLLQACKAIAEEGGIAGHVSFETEMDHTLLPDFYRSLDLFVLPSYFEGFGCVFTEAWACGTPFITCEGQGMDDLIFPEDRPLWLCKPRNPEDLAEKIANYCRNRPEQRLSAPIDIDTLVPRFLDEVEGLRAEGR